MSWSSNEYTNRNFKIDFKNLILDKVQTIYWYKTECPICGYKNHPENFARFCPKCGEDLKVGEGHELVSDE